MIYLIFWKIEVGKEFFFLNNLTAECYCVFLIFVFFCFIFLIISHYFVNRWQNGYRYKYDRHAGHGRDCEAATRDRHWRHRVRLSQSYCVFRSKSVYFSSYFDLFFFSRKICLDFILWFLRLLAGAVTFNYFVDGRLR